MNLIHIIMFVIGLNVKRLNECCEKVLSEMKKSNNS